MTAHGRLTWGLSILTLLTLGAAFAIIAVLLDREQEKQLDTALLDVAHVEAAEAPGNHFSFTARPGPAANDVGPLDKYGVIFDDGGNVLAATPPFDAAPPRLGDFAPAIDRPFDFMFGGRAYRGVLASIPGSFAAEQAGERIAALPAPVRERFVKAARAEGARLLAAGEPAKAKDRLLPAAYLGDEGARAALRDAYRRLPRYSGVLLAPELAEDTLPELCGDAAACRLLQLGLPEDAEPIVRDARRLDTILGCLVASRLAEDADAGPAALEAAEALERKVPRDFLLELAPRTILRGLAPRPFDRLVAQAASELSVPRGLLYAIMRQESRFDREAASPAAARGLMQLTLPAAGEAARELNEEPPAYSELYDPARSIRLGARTLRSLLDRLGDEPALAASGYNAGAGQTILWSGGSERPAEALLAAISYAETRTYVRRVLANRRAYRLALPPEETIGGRR